MTSLKRTARKRRHADTDESVASFCGQVPGQFDTLIFPLKRNVFGLSRVDSQSSNSSSSSSSSSSSLPASATSTSYEDDLEFLFNDAPAMSQLSEETAVEHAAESPTIAVLDCFANSCHFDQTESSAIKFERRRIKRMRTEYEPSSCTKQQAASTDNHGGTAQAVLHQVNGLLESAKRLNSETSLLRLQASKLVEEVMSSRRRLLVNEQPNSV